MERFSLKSLFNRERKARERRAHPRTSPPQNTTILIVDDSRTIVFSLKKMLEQNGYKTLSAGNGEEAISVARQSLPDLILMDVIMPSMNGFRATRTLSKDPETAHIPIIIMSGDDQAMQKFWVNSIGAADFLTKPFSRGAIFQKVEQQLKQIQVA